MNQATRVFDLASAGDPAGSVIAGFIYQYGTDGHTREPQRAVEYYDAAMRAGWGNVAALKAAAMTLVGNDLGARQTAEYYAERGFSRPRTWLQEQGLPVPPVIQQAPAVAAGPTAAESIGNILGSLIDIAGAVYVGYAAAQGDRSANAAAAMMSNKSSSAGTAGSCKGYAGPGGPCYAGPGGPAYAGPGGARHDGPGGAAYSGPGGACYSGPGGACYSGPGGGSACPSFCR